jgi:DNA uptake protein ComE-like DNA-binding protein
MKISYQVTEVIQQSNSTVEYKNQQPNIVTKNPVLSRVTNIVGIPEFPDFPEPKVKPVNINKGSIEDLLSLGLSKSTIEKVIKERIRFTFSSLDELDSKIPLPFKKKWSEVLVVFE